jgi:cytoskeletal protein CcmA (bactofilin family)
MSDRSDLSVLGPSTRLTGRVTGKGGLRVEGVVSGDVMIEGPAEVADGASVEGDLTAESLDLGGSVAGNVTTTGPVVVRAGARLRGEVKGAEVAIEPGARVSIRLDTPFELNLGSKKR